MRIIKQPEATLTVNINYSVLTIHHCLFTIHDHASTYHTRKQFSDTCF